MPVDTRELILARIIVALDDMPEVQAVYRDRADLLAVDKLPAFVVLDGSERTLSKIKTGRQIVALPMIVELRPQIFFLMKPLPIKDAGEYPPILSHWRLEVLRAILFDAELNRLTGPNGAIEYNGHETDMQAGRSMEGQIQFDFSFQYYLNPNDL